MDVSSDAAIEKVLADTRAALGETKAVPTDAPAPTLTADKAPETPAPPAEPETESKDAPVPTWVPEEYREGFKQASPEHKQWLRDLRANIITAADEKFQAAASDRKDAERWRQLEKDPEWRKAVLEARKGSVNGNGHKEPDSKSRRWLDADSDEEFDRRVEERVKEIVEPLVETKLTAPERHARAVDAAIVAAYDEAGEDVTPQVRDAANRLLTADLAARTNGKPYSGISPETVPLVLPGYIRAAKAELQAKVATKPTPAPVTAKAASIRGLGPTGSSESEPAWVREKRAPTAEEFWGHHTRSTLGLSDEQMRVLRAGKQITRQ